VKGNVVDLETVTRSVVPAALGEWDGRTVDWWERAWGSAQSSAWTDEQLPYLYELGDSLDRYWQLMAEVEKEPVVYDRFGQAKPNPAYQMAKGEWDRARDLSAQLGLLLKSKLDMGLKATEVEKASSSLRSRAARAVPDDPRKGN
jgi:hypothetical protein